MPVPDLSDPEVAAPEAKVAAPEATGAGESIEQRVEREVQKELDNFGSQEPEVIELATCYRCSSQGAKAEMYKRSSRSKQFKCKGCNRDESKLQRAYSQDSEVAEEFKALGKEEINKFLDENKQLDLKEFIGEMKARVTLIKKKASTTERGLRGNYKPLSWYTNHGYNDEQVQSISRNCDSYFHPQLNCDVYCLEEVMPEGHRMPEDLFPLPQEEPLPPDLAPSLDEARPGEIRRTERTKLVRDHLALARAARRQTTSARQSAVQTAAARASTGASAWAMQSWSALVLPGWLNEISSSHALDWVGGIACCGKCGGTSSVPLHLATGRSLLSTECRGQIPAGSVSRIAKLRSGRFIRPWATWPDEKRDAKETAPVVQLAWSNEHWTAAVLLDSQ